MIGGINIRRLLAAREDSFEGIMDWSSIDKKVRGDNFIDNCQQRFLLEIDAS